MQINDRESRSDYDAPDEIDAGNCIPWKGSRWNSEYKCSEQTDELENGNHQISRGKFDPVQYGDYFVERNHFENTEWQSRDKSYCDAKFPSHRENTSTTDLIAFPCYNHVTPAAL